MSILRRKNITTSFSFFSFSYFELYIEATISKYKDFNYRLHLQNKQTQNIFSYYY